MPSNNEPVIYKSPFPPTPVSDLPLFTFLESQPHPDSSPIFTSAATGETITRGRLFKDARRLSKGLKEKKGLKVDEAVLVFSPNSIHYPVAVLGAFANGNAASLVNIAYTPPELKHQLEHSQSKLVFVDPSLLSTLYEAYALLPSPPSKEQIAKMTVLLTSDVKERKDGIMIYTDLMDENDNVGWVAPTPNSDSRVALLCYSSGTTGLPKGVMTSQRNIVALLPMVKSAFPTITPGKDVSLGVLPFSHIYAISKNVLYSIYTGSQLVIMPKFDLDLWCGAVQRYKATFSLIVPPIVIHLANSAVPNKYDLSSLRWLMSGAAPLSSAVADRVEKRFPHLVICMGYGLTETSPTTHISPLKDHKRKRGTIGPIMANLEARLVGVDDGLDIVRGSGEEGELWIRGPTIMKGYLRNAEATKNAITADAWFKTGDVAKIDEEGYWSITDRAKELIKVKGFQVAPAELEATLLEHPDVADVAVIGINDESRGTELPRAYIVPRQPLKSAEEKEKYCAEVSNWLAAKVANHKRLRGGIIIIDVIPKSPSGKILRRSLRDLAKAELALPKAKL